MESTKAKIISAAEDEGLQATIEIEGKQFIAMDCFGYTCRVKEGEILDVELEIGLDDRSETWEDIFNGNPAKERKLVQVKDWSYKAYGKIIDLNPVVVDCGVVKFEDVIQTNDRRCVGEYISFSIDRLDIWAASS
jgi:hypothetical protein